MLTVRTNINLRVRRQTPQHHLTRTDNKLIYSLPTETILEVVRLANKRNPWGGYVCTHGDIARLTKLNRGQVLSLCRHFKLPPRPRGSNWNPRPNCELGRKSSPTGRPRYKIPTSLVPMYYELRSKVGGTTARKLVKEHATIRGIV